MKSDRIRAEIRRVGFFLLAGFVGLLVNMGVTYALTELSGLWYFWSFLIGTLVSWSVSFVINARLTFPGVRSPGELLRRFGLYVSGYLGFFWINAGIVYVLATILDVPYLAAIVASAVTTTAGTFLMSRSLVFGIDDPVYIRKLLIRHWMAVAGAVLVAGLVVSPQLYFKHAEPAYEGIAMMGTDAEEHILARIQDVREGNGGLGNTFMSDKDQPYLIPGLGEWIIGTASVPLQLSSIEANAAAKFAFSFADFLLIYAVTYLLARSRLAAVLAALAVTTAQNLISDPLGPLQYLAGTDVLTGFVAFARPINPEVTSFFLYAGLLVFVRAWMGRRSLSVREAALYGIITGASLYTSPYMFTFLGMLGIVAFLYHLFRKEWARGWRYFISGGSAVIVLIPFIVNYLSLSTDPLYLEAAARQGLLETRVPIFGVWMAVLLGSAFLRLGRDRDTVGRGFFVLAGVTLVVLLNQQVLTGFSLQHGHFHWYLTKPLATILLVTVFVHVLRSLTVRAVLIRRCVIAIALAALLLNATLLQISSYQHELTKAQHAQPYAALFQALPKDLAGALWTDRTLSLYLPIYTSYDAPNNEYATYYLNANETLAANLLIEYRLRGVRSEDALERMKQERADISLRFFGTYWRDRYGDSASIPDALLEGYAQAYAAVEGVPLAELLARVGAKHVLWDEVREPGWKFDDSLSAPKAINDRFSLVSVE